uniref:PHD-type domain-containing protein n=1 Tax=Moniliophthora roreri TaxID=221103 RepID=A0A0W0FCX5_MONRR
MAAENGSEDTRWGRVLICGGTDWPRLGKRDKPNAKEDEEEHPDLPEPHILRSLGNVKARSIHTSCSGCHFVVLDTGGAAYLFGRNTFSSLGLDPSHYECVSENAPMKLLPTELGASTKTNDGNVWAAGDNRFGQCGQPPSAQVGGFKQISGLAIDGEREHAIMASAGITFSLVLTRSGRVFALGSAEKGQLGNGATGERITTGNKTAFDLVDEPLLIRSLADKKIVQIASGQQHSLALDDQGYIYVWGYNGYCRLGLGNQVDRLRPEVVPQFITEVVTQKEDGDKEKKEVGTAKLIAAGPTNSVVVDKQGMYWLAGKWKNSGDGSSGSPYTTFRYIQDIMACKVVHAACGGVTHWVLTPDESDEKPAAPGTQVPIMTVAWGQNASNCELGLGVDEPKSATKPTRHVPLDGIDVIQIAAGQNTTLFLARPPPPDAPAPQANGGAKTAEDEDEEEGDKWSNLPRYPEEVVDTPELCLVCGKDNGDDDSPLECEKCDNPYHLSCLNPPLKAIPDGEWFCPKCEATPGAALRGYTAPSYKKSASGSEPTSAAMDVDEDEEDKGGRGSSGGGRGGKRKASGADAKGAKKKKQ